MTWDDEVLLCTKCNEKKPDDQFAKEHRNTGRRGRRSHCRSCVNQYYRGFVRNSSNPKEYDDLLEQQNGLCAICLSPPAKNKRLSVDHDHESGMVRGLLCTSCNLALGMLGDTTDRVRTALAYLEKPCTGITYIQPR